MNKPDFSAFNLEPPADCQLPVPQGAFWVFAYGSLMWDPGFEMVRAEPAVLYGFHRRLCLWSVRYRGTAASPGLVLGLDKGGSCKGMGIEVHENNTDVVCEYLKEREMLSNAYHPVVKPIYLEDSSMVTALTFVSKRDHPQYAKPLPLEDTVNIINGAKGQRGPNRQYVVNTAEHLSSCGIHNTEIHRVAARLT